MRGTTTAAYCHLPTTDETGIHDVSHVGRRQAVPVQVLEGHHRQLEGDSLSDEKPVKSM